MTTLEIRAATTEEQHRVISAIALAFVQDPVTRWTYPDPHDFMTHFPALVCALGGRAFEHDSAHVAGAYVGGALWLPPGIHPDDTALDSLMERTVSSEKRQIAARIFEEMARYHPTEPHWYLPMLGVDPNEQGRGHGAALLRYGLERVDRERLPAYLESTNPANISLYQRHGFEVLGTIQVEDAPPLIPMFRPVPAR